MDGEDIPRSIGLFPLVNTVYETHHIVDDFLSFSLDFAHQVLKLPFQHRGLPTGSTETSRHFHPQNLVKVVACTNEGQDVWRAIVWRCQTTSPWSRSSPVFLQLSG